MSGQAGSSPGRRSSSSNGSISSRDSASTGDPPTLSEPTFSSAAVSAPDAQGAEQGASPPHDRAQAAPSDVGRRLLARAALVSGVVLLGVLIAITAVAVGTIAAASIRGGLPDLSRGALSVIALVAMQMTMLALTIWFAWRWGPLVPTLSLGRPQAKRGAYLWLFLSACMLLGVTIVVATLIFRQQFETDASAFVPMLRSEVGWLAIAAVIIGAPLSEELLFRGLLFGALQRGGASLGVAMLMTNLMWTALHAGYSVIGLIEVFAAGILLTLALVISRSIWVPIALHAFYNCAALGLIFALLDVRT